MIQTSIPFADYDAAIKAGNRQRMRITFPNKTLTEKDMYVDGFTYTEVLNSDTDLAIGKAVCSSFEIPIVNDGSYSDFDFKQRFTVELGITIGDTVQYAPLGTFIGEKPERLLQDTIQLTGYDLMTLFDEDASLFLAGLTYPTTIQALFNALCTRVGVQYDSTQACPNINRIIVASPFDGQGVTYRDILAWIAEACGCYARMSRTGKCELVWFTQTDYSINSHWYYDVNVEEFTVPAIDQVRIQVTENDIGVSYPYDGTFANSYPVYDNPYLYGNSEAEISGAAQSLYERLSTLQQYKPCTVDADGNWLIQCGDIITITMPNGTETISLPVFSLTLTWAGRAEIVYQSTGTEVRQAFSTTHKNIVRQNAKFHEFIVTIDEFKSEIISLTNKTYVQDTDPVDTVGTGALRIGDYWVNPSRWIDVLEYTWEEICEKDWQDLFIFAKCWDGHEWVTVSDLSIISEHSTRIEQNEDAIVLEAKRANAIEGELRSGIEMNAESISMEVVRAKGSEESLSTKIDITAESVKSEILSTVNKTYLQEEDPCITEGTGKIKRGDFWITGGAFDTWEKVKASTWEGFSANNWQKIKEYTWADLMPIVRSWNGKEWVIVSDATQPAILSSKIEQTKELIGLEVKRANAAEGTLQANIDMTAESISLEVDRASQAEGKLSASIQVTANSITSEVKRATQAEGTLQSNITQTAEDIRLGVKSAGKVSTVGSYILIESNKVEIKSGGNIDIKSGGTFTVASDNFKIDSSGNVKMSGKVTSTEGQIGGWYIGTDYIGNKNSKTSSSVGLHAMTASEETNASNVYILWAGSATQSSANFSVKGDGTVTIKKGSLNINSGKFVVDAEGNVTIKRGSLAIGGSDDNPNFAVDTSGNVTIKHGSININNGKFEVTSSGVMTAKEATLTGTLYAKEGRIGATESSGTYSGGFIIKANKMYTDGKTSYNSSTEGVYIGTDGIGLGTGEFYIKKDGSLTATKGQIGGWYIGSDYIGNKSTKGSSAVGLHALTDSDTASSTYVLWAGSSTQSSANFSVKGDGTVSIKSGTLNINSNFIVDSDGTVTIKKGSLAIGSNFSVATDGTVEIKKGTLTIGSNFSVSSTGSLTAKDGTIGGWYIGSNYLGNASTLASSTIGMYSSGTSSNIVFWSGGTRSGTPTFSVTANGKLYASNAEISGKVTASSGKIGVDSDGNYGWSIDSRQISSGSGSYYIALNSDSYWDGTKYNPDTGTYGDFRERYAIWCGNASSSSAPFRVSREGKVYAKKFITVTEPDASHPSGTETTINLSSYPLWKLNYSTIKQSTISTDGDGKCTAFTLSNGTTVNFKSAATARAEGWSAARSVIAWPAEGTTDSFTVRIPSGSEQDHPNYQDGNFTLSTNGRYASVKFQNIRTVASIDFMPNSATWAHSYVTATVLNVTCTVNGVTYSTQIST